MDLSVVFTRGLVFTMYALVFVHAVAVLHKMTGNWTRKATLVIVALISGYWAAFYMHLLVVQFDVVLTANAIAMWSRVGHVITAVGLWTTTSFLNMVRKQYALVAVKEEDFE